MSVPKHRKNKSRVRVHRSHHALKTTKPKLCPKCQEPVRSHTACLACGYYKGKQVIKTKSDIKLQREEKRKKRESRDKEKMQKLKNK